MNPPRDENDRLRDGDLGDDPREDCEEEQDGELGSKEPDPRVLDLLDWKYKKQERDYPIRKMRNVVTVLRHDRRWKRRLLFNELSHLHELDGDLISDEAETAAALWIDEVYGFTPPTAWLSEAMRLVALETPYHPVREYLERVRWDGVERLPAMLEHYWHAPPDDLTRVIGVCWMVGCVARIFRPGCQMDNALILVGSQGFRKSSSIRYGLVPDLKWFDDTKLDLSGSKDSQQKIGERWIYEIAEMVGARKKEIEDVKAFLTIKVDSYRPPYGRNVLRRPRQVVFVGTTNEDAFLRDPTGNRRFWPVRVQAPARVEELARDRDLLWAEAVARFRRGDTWHLNRAGEDQLAESNLQYEEEDPWLSSIGRAIEPFSPGVTFTVSRVLDEIPVPAEKRTRHHDNRVADVLKRLGCERAGRAPLRDGKARLWRKPIPPS